MSNLTQPRAKVSLQRNSWYQTRDGKLVKIVNQVTDKHVIDPFDGSNGASYYPDGRWKRNSESNRDLIREVSDAETIMEIINEEGAYYKIKGAPGSVVVEIRKKPNPRASVGYGDSNQVFQTLLETYLKFKEHNV